MSYAPPTGCNYHGIIVYHNASRQSIQALFEVFAKPMGHHDKVDWVAPAWWYLMYATAHFDA